MVERINNGAHDWLLAGPWYRRQSLGGGAVDRSQRPIIQKYASSDFASDLIDDPEHSLRFVGEDFVNQTSLVANSPVTPDTPGVANNSLKLFLDAHSRFYIVMCELHCDAPGYPNVSRDQVAEAGFVVRRFSTRLNDSQRQVLQPVLRHRALLQARINRVTRGLKNLYSTPASGPGKFQLRNSLNRKQSKKLAELNAALAQNNEELQKLKAENGISVETQGWGLGNHKGIGEWRDLRDETPQELTGHWLDRDDEVTREASEQTFPLYPLIADPAQDKHSARGRSMWYGVIPTQSADVDEQGNPRFDDVSAYEVRCFVRRQPDCDPDSGECCPGELVWSEGTEVYRLAAFYDLDGCGHKPVNIKMPNLENLKQQVARGPAGKGANVRVNTPEKSSLAITLGDDFALPDTGGDPGNGSICFFAIPLITIVAMFLLRLVLPIVVFLFNLWFLLSLRLCIPPSISLDAGLAADLKLIPPEFDFEAEFSVGASLEIGGQLVSTLDELGNVLEGKNPDGSNNPNFDGFDSDKVLDAKVREAMFERLREGEDVHDILRSMVDVSTNYGDEPVAGVLSGTLPEVADGLHYFDPVGGAA